MKNELYLPPDIGRVIPVAAVKTPEGMVIPKFRRRGIAKDPHPSGEGIFAKWAVRIVDKRGRTVPFRSPVTGKMVKRLDSPVHSFTRNLAFLMRGFLQNLDASINVNETLTDDAGNPFISRIRSNSSISGSSAIVSATCKIKFGGSSAALDNTQFNLQGVLLGPTTEATCTITVAGGGTGEDTTSTIFKVTGQITNGSGSSFTVREMGIFGELTSQSNVPNNTAMLLRDLTGDVVVGNTQTIIGEYTFTLAI
jgi:hypothetical protein